jgi:hypothetical protein
MPLARVGGVTLFFAHIPKTGGTSVEGYLRRKGPLMLHGGAAWARAPLQHLHRAAWEDILPSGAWDHGFVVLRDPLDRLVSEFRMRAEPMRMKLRPLGAIRAARNRLAGRSTYAVRVGGRVELLGFDDWVDRIFAEYGRDPWIASNHIRPQHEFVGDGLHLFRLEDGLDRVFRWIDQVTGTPAVEGGFHERRSQALPVTVSPETAARVRDFYREDYVLLDGLTAR